LDMAGIAKGIKLSAASSGRECRRLRRALLGDRDVWCNLADCHRRASAPNFALRFTVFTSMSLVA
jgi:hypothetical protein